MLDFASEKNMRPVRAGQERSWRDERWKEMRQDTYPGAFLNDAAATPVQQNGTSVMHSLQTVNTARST